MNKKKIHQQLFKLKPVSYWYFLVAFLISLSISATALRHNNLTAINLRTKLYAVDKQNGDVSLALNNLRQYVYSHMNTNLANGPGTIYPPIQLTYTYQRLNTAAQSTLAADKAKVSAENAQIYTDAENYCQNQIPTGFSGRYRIDCVTNYVLSHPVAKESGSQQSIPTALYEFDFISPFWSPDFSGWSVLVTFILFIFFIVRLVLELILKRKLKHHS